MPWTLQNCTLVTESTKTITDISEIKRIINQVLSIAIPTTSGSGAESTKFTTVWDEKMTKTIF